MDLCSLQRPVRGFILRLGVASLMPLKSNALMAGHQGPSQCCVCPRDNKISHSAFPRLFDRAQIHCIPSLSIAYFQIPFHTLIKLLLDSEELKSFYEE